MRRSLAVILLVPALLAVSPAAEAVPTCGGKKATMVFGEGDDQVHGTKGDDVVVLGGGDDRFISTGGHDTVCGGPGEDLFVDQDGARQGRALFDGGSGVDRLSLGGSGLRIDVAAGKETGHGGDRFRRIEVFDGSAGDDRFLGSAAGETFAGRGGDDQVALGDGDDTASVGQASMVDAGDGDDEVAVLDGTSVQVVTGAGDDYVQLGYSTASVDGGEGTDGIGFWYGDTPTDGVTVDLAAGTANQARYGTFGIVGFENVFGSLGDDVIYGDDGPNLLLGSRGTDYVDGRGGDDRCVGTVVVNC